MLHEASVAKEFAKYFQPVFANTAELLEKCYRLRHQVFAEELNYEPIKASGLEQDEYDPYSYHFLLKHLPSGKFAGTVRLVAPNSLQGNDIDLPFETYCKQGINPELIDLSEIPRETYGEVSRLAISKEFRRRSSDAGKQLPLGNAENDVEDSLDRRSYPFIPLGLYLIAASMGVQLKLDYAFIMIEPLLARHMSRYGIKFNKGGKPIEYHGRRQLYYITKSMLFENMNSETQSLFSHIDDCVASALSEQLPAVNQ